MSSTILPPLLSGALFGAALTASRVYLPNVIISQMLLKDFHMMSVFLTASASSAVIMLAFEHLGISARKVRSNSSFGWFGKYDANVIGGACIGVGMTLTGACPGTVIVQLGTGVESAMYVAAGGLLGGMAYARFGERVIARGEEVDPETIGAKLSVDATKVFVAFEVMCAVAVTAVTVLAKPGQYVWVHPVAGGLLVGAAQAASILLTDTPLGTSGAYEQIGRYLWQGVGSKDVAAPPSPPRALIFVIGILAASAISVGYMPGVLADPVHVSRVSAIFGGFIMILGGRAAGGCTSGHGISGLAAFSFSSLITVASMFGGGIGMAMLVR